MKLATLRDGTRDGALHIVSNDLTLCVSASGIADTLQQAIDHWSLTQPALQTLADKLENGLDSASAFVPQHALSPLPRAYQWADASAYVNHVELVRRARGASLPESFWHEPLMYQGGSDTFLAPTDPIRLAEEDWGIDMEAEVAAIVDDVPMGASPEQCKQAIRLLMLVNDISLRNLIPNELAKGFGFYHGKPSTTFSPLAVTPDELGDAWDGSKLHLPLLVEYNGKLLGKANAGVDMTFDFPQLIAHAAKTRPLGAGTIIGSGTVSNKLDGGPGCPVSDGGVGYSCIAELRTVETLTTGQAQTPFMHFGDRVRIEMKDSNYNSIFGAIDQVVEKYTP